MNDKHDNDLFDAAMRARYRQAAGSVSPATRARLRQARQDAVTDSARKRGFSWPLLFGGAAAAVFAVAFGLNLRQDALQGTDPSAPATVVADYAEPASALDQDPDFYAWLGSSDAELVAVE